jgi:hypothetical protein
VEDVSSIAGSSWTASVPSNLIALMTDLALAIADRPPSDGTHVQRFRTGILLARHDDHEVATAPYLEGMGPTHLVLD